jgi:hypothetical protein
VIDNNLSTRWTASGLGSSITADLGAQKTICSTDISWYRGSYKTYNFVVAVSTDGKSYVNVYTGKSSGTTTSAERYSFTEASGRYVRITSNNLSVGINELDVNGYTPAADSTAPSVTITNPAAGTALSVGTLKVTGTASDNAGGSGVNTVQVRIGSGSYVAATPKATGDWSTWSASLSATSSGSQTLYAKATDKAGNSKENSLSLTLVANSNDASIDKFGIKKLFPTKSGGNEWYVNMADPDGDPLFRNLPSMTKQSDGSWQVSGGSNGQVRMEAWSPESKKWLNVEITMYAKMVSGSNELLQMYSRGGHHTSSNECLGSAYKARLYGDGEARWVKEVTHPAYTGNRGAMQVTDDPLKGRWIGFKAVIYNFVQDGKTFVRMQSYVDDDVTDSNGNLVIKNNWKLASVVEDRGGWSTSDSDFNATCAPLNKDSTKQYRQRDEIINTSGGTSTQNIAAWRSDDLTWNWKYLTVREIVPPS